jgi:hypothetical protein
MKAISQAIAFSLLLLPFAQISQAEETPPPPPPPHEMQPGMGMPGMQGMQPGMGMHKGMGMHDELDMEHLKEQQEHLLKMHDLSTRILAEKDPQKQQALKDEQLEVMKAHVQALKERRHKMKMGHPAPPAQGKK